MSAGLAGSARLARAAAVLGLAERSIALVDRCRPLNAAAEARRVSELWAQGRPTNPAWVYAPPPDLGQLRSELERLRSELARGDAVEALYAARARELELEARIAEAVGVPRFKQLARERYPLPVAGAVRERARAWTALGPRPAERAEGAIRSDDRAHPESLLSQVLAAVAARRLPISVMLRDDLQSVAATTTDGVLIKPGVLLRAREAHRIALHEVEGHVLPRLRARSAPLGLFRVASAGAADDEEGRALAIERRAGLFGRERQVELGRRHLAASAAAEGADWLETVRILIDCGTPDALAMEIAQRVQRGGGLAREVVYLPALERVEQAFEREPELDAWLAAGRLSIEAARILKRVMPELVSAAGPDARPRRPASRAHQRE